VSARRANVVRPARFAKSQGFLCVLSLLRGKSRGHSVFRSMLTGEQEAQRQKRDANFTESAS
jgi:hypothetical protein